MRRRKSGLPDLRTKHARSRVNPRSSALRPLAFGEGQEEGPAKRGRTTAYPVPPRIRAMTLALARYLSKPGTRLRCLREIFVDDIPINRRQRAQIGDRDALVDGMHGLPDQAEFHHRAMGGDEARIGGAAAGGAVSYTHLTLPTNREV